MYVPDGTGSHLLALVEGEGGRMMAYNGNKNRVNSYDPDYPGSENPSWTWTNVTGTLNTTYTPSAPFTSTVNYKPECAPSVDGLGALIPGIYVFALIEEGNAAYTANYHNSTFSIFHSAVVDTR